jgi:hypothetical protein
MMAGTFSSIAAVKIYLGSASRNITASFMTTPISPLLIPVLSCESKNGRKSKSPLVYGIRLLADMLFLFKIYE